MPTRYNSKSKTTHGVPGLPSGYDGNSSSMLTIPSVGMEDVDVALFTMFDKEIPFQVSGDGAPMKDVPVVFAVGEKAAVLKKGRALRDKKNTLILPLITIQRTTVQQTANEDIAGRGINQQTGEIVIKRRLDKSDRTYQGLINRLFLKHQTNLAVPQAEADEGQLTTERSVGELSPDPTVKEGGLMIPDRMNNIYETIVIPAPRFYTAVYEVTFWTQYVQHMNQLLEQLVNSFLPQGQSWRVDTPKGYWFVAKVDNDTYTAENNFDDLSTTERMVKYKFTVKVPAYILASAVPGAPVPLKRYVSQPIVRFDVGLNVGEETGAGDTDDPFLGADDPTLPLEDGKSRRRDQRASGHGRVYPNQAATNPDDPALKSLSRGRGTAQYKKVLTVDGNGNEVVKYVRVTSVNPHTGETVFAPGTDLGGLTIVVTDD